MHRLRHHRLARKLKFTSLVTVVGTISIFVFATMVIATFFFREIHFAIGTGISLTCMVLFWAFILATGGSCRCQLCQAPMMAQRKCSRHRKAKKSLGSYRLKLATSFLFTDSYTCPFCGESFTSQVVEKSILPVSTEEMRGKVTLPMSHARANEPTRRTQPPAEGSAPTSHRRAT